jgi:alkanesulfonate monooxygenase SsuD/methylene tetrahydromethanopterin reductase-like flavin-dependent oxidoreductase (luciferase family)
VTPPLRTAVALPTFGDLDARAVGELAGLAEQAGWDGVFCWDHMLYDPVGRGVADTTVALTAIAMSTSRVLLGPLVMPLARRRPWKVAREIASLDTLSGGRFVLGVGNGDDLDFAPVGDPAPARERAAVLDESLVLLQRLLHEDGPVTHHGDAFTVDGVELHARTAQGRVPVWVAGRWPHRRPLQRAARWDGVVPLWPGFATPSPDEFAACLDVVHDARRGTAQEGSPFDGVLWIQSDEEPKHPPAAYAEVGVTWWVQSFDPRADLATVRRRVEAGPPAHEAVR